MLLSEMPGPKLQQKPILERFGGQADSVGRRSGGEGGRDGRGHRDAVPRGEPLRLERHWGATLRWKGTRKEEGVHYSAIGGEAEMGWDGKTKGARVEFDNELRRTTKPGGRQTPVHDDSRWTTEAGELASTLVDTCGVVLGHQGWWFGRCWRTEDFHTFIAYIRSLRLCFVLGAN